MIWFLKKNFFWLDSPEIYFCGWPWSILRMRQVWFTNTTILFCNQEKTTIGWVETKLLYLRAVTQLIVFILYKASKSSISTCTNYVLVKYIHTFSAQLNWCKDVKLLVHDLLWEVIHFLFGSSQIGRIVYMKKTFGNSLGIRPNIYP